MFDHLSIGTRDVAAAKKFYNAVLEPLGYTCLSESEGGAGYGSKSPQFWIQKSIRPVAADAESGLHFCFTAPTRASVAAFHAAALQAGGKDNGKPGLRADYGPDYYAAFVLDLDGYRLEAYTNRK